MNNQDVSRLQANKSFSGSGVGENAKHESFAFEKVAFAVLALAALLCALMPANVPAAYADELRADTLQTQSAAGLAPGDRVYFGGFSGSR